jgi:hypothetical protein
MYKTLFGIHFLLTILGLWLVYYFTQQEAAPVRYADYSAAEDIATSAEEPFDSVQMTVYALYILVGAQALFVLNILLALFRRRAK